MFNKGFGAGRTVYGGGSFAPHKGQVSAQGSQGYLRRSLAQNAQKKRFNGFEGRPQGAMRIGNDGKSDTRSGLAQMAMQRQGDNKWAGFDNPGAHSNPAQPGQPGGGGPVNPNAPSGAGSGAGTPVPAVQIGANGQMQLPYDAGYNEQVMGHLANFNDQLMQLQMGQQQQAAQYQMSMRDENQGFQQRQLGDLATNAGAGTAFSSRYATDVGHTYGAHQNAINDLESGNTQYNQQVAAQKAAIQDNYNSSLAAAAAERARNAAANAGNLGYGHAGGAGGGNNKPASGGGNGNGNGNGNGGGKGVGNGPNAVHTPNTKPNRPGSSPRHPDPNHQIHQINHIIKHGPIKNGPTPGTKPRPKGKK